MVNWLKECDQTIYDLGDNPMKLQAAFVYRGFQDALTGWTRLDEAEENKNEKEDKGTD